jgi:MFS family permease
VRFHDSDPDDPYNWRQARKVAILGIVILSVFNSTMGSGLAANIGSLIADEWNITNNTLLILPTSMYIVGYIIGPLIWGPLSEHLGRR